MDHQEWRKRVSKSLPRKLLPEKRIEMLDRILKDLQYAALTELDLPPYLEKLKRTFAVAKQFQADLDRSARALLSKKPVDLGINPDGENRAYVPWVELYKIIHDSNRALTRWSAIYERRGGRRKETAPWLRKRLEFFYRYYTGRSRGWKQLFKAVDDSEHLRVGLGEKQLPKISPKSKAKKHPL
jgi:adenosine deaminase